MSTTQRSSDLMGARILVVGGLDADAALLTAALTPAGCALAFTADLLAARAAVDAGRADCVLLDVMQPRSDVLALIASAGGRTPVIVTGPPESNARIAVCLAAGADDHLATPYDAELVRHRIALVVSRRRLAREAERARERSDANHLATTRFVPREILDLLAKQSLADITLSDFAAREMAVFFTDIRNFTALSETMTPHENFRFLNSFLSHVTPVIRANGGFIDKYIGDAVMALFPRAPGDALAAAVELLRRMGPYNAGRRRAGYEPIRIGIGAHHGPLILGTIGEAERMQTTVISDTVNVAARLEGLTKTFGVDLLVSGSILDGLVQPERFNLRHLGAVKAKGKTASVDVYECFDLDPPELIAHKLQTAPLFAQALAEFGRGTFLTAGRLFQRVAAANPSDGPAAHYRDRCSLFAVRGTGVEKWDGADLIETK